MRDARCEMRDARCEMRDARYEMREIGFAKGRCSGDKKRSIKLRFLLYSLINN
ncbi:hypothetical protein VCR9J2_50105 [Vibrio crassostreae]|nr:hypothetical protein VCR9J2_50105 [Vibrio crassostreae]